GTQSGSDGINRPDSIHLIRSLPLPVLTREIMTDTWHRGDYTISTDRSRLNLDLIHDYISNHSYWGKGRAREVVQRSIDNSLPFGIYKSDEQVGFARIVTDYATFAWVADVFVLPEHRGRGLWKSSSRILSCRDFVVGFYRPKTRKAYTNDMDSCRSNDLNVGWSVSIRT